jgi:hypothetical protein
MFRDASLLILAVFLPQSNHLAVLGDVLQERPAHIIIAY